MCSPYSSINSSNFIWKFSGKRFSSSILEFCQQKNWHHDQLKYMERTEECKKMNQNIVSMVSFLFDGAFSAFCFCKSINVEPLLANNLRKLITESSLKLPTARSACTRSYLHNIIQVSISVRSLGYLLRSAYRTRDVWHALHICA